VLIVAFVKYCKGKSNKRSSDCTIGINQKGRFAFYKPVVQKYLQGADYVELLFDPEDRQIGIVPLAKATADALPIQGKTTKMVIAKKFLNKFNINIENKRYEFSNDGQMIIIKI
jgi:hypothetical protein